MGGANDVPVGDTYRFINNGEKDGKGHESSYPSIKTNIILIMVARYFNMNILAFYHL